MTTKAAGVTGAPDGDVDPGPVTGPPPPPVPPRSRLLDHLLTGMLGPVLTAVALWFFGRGAFLTAVGPSTGGTEYSDGAGRIAGAALLLAVVALSARWSSLGLAISGGLVLAAGILARVWPAKVFDLLGMPDGGASPDGWTSAADGHPGLALLLDTGSVLALGAVLSASALGVHGARRAGRARERAEAALAPARDATTGAVPVPPRSRAGAHAAAVVAGVLLPPLAVLVLHGTIPVLAEAGVREAPGEAVLHGVAVVALALVAASVAFSSIGSLVAGVLWGLGGGGYLLLRTDELPGLAALGLSEAPGAVELARTGLLPVVGAVLVGGALAAHEARRSGARQERAELAAAAARG